MVLAFELMVSAVLAGAASSVPPDIRHEPLRCVAPGENLIVNAVIPGTDIRTAKVYFRSDKYPKFYYVEMKSGAEGFLSVLPKPSPETASIVYYIEAIDVTFDNTIGAEHVVEVTETCVHADREWEAPEEPEIIVGAAEPGASALPPGFEAAGIVGTITAAGVGSILGGGSGVGTAVAVGGVAAGVGGAVATRVLLEDPPPADDVSDPPPSRPEPAPPTSSSPSPSPPPMDSPPSPGPPSPEPPEEDAGPAPPPPKDDPAPAPASLTACFEASFPGRSCNLKVDASCSTGSIARYAWEFAASSELGGRTTALGVTANRTFPRCAGEVVSVTLTVSDGAGGTDVVQRPVMLPDGASTLVRESVHTSWVSTLDAHPWNGAVRGAIEIDGARGVTVSNAGPHRYEHDAHLGKSTVEATLLTGAGSEVLWTFDLSETDHLASGSLRPLMGSVIAANGRRITFRLSGAPGERVRFEFRLGR